MADFSQWYDPNLEPLAPAGVAPQPQQDWSGSAPATWEQPTPPQAGAISPTQRAFLTAMRGGESGGRYNVMYGGGTFDDFADHPNKPQLITSGPNAGKYSTAAGADQFLYSTWQEAKKALDLKDFSPENQDRAAAWLAQRDYGARTGGRDLWSDIEAAKGDTNALNRIGANLSQTWTSLPGGIERNAEGSKFGSRLSAYLNGEKLPDVPQSRSDIYASAQSKTRSLLVPVDHDPFNIGVSGGETPNQSSGMKAVDRLLGLGGEERFQLWPEKMVRSGATIARDVLTGAVSSQPGLRREDFTDAAPPGVGDEGSTWLGQKLGLRPLTEQPGDELVGRAMDLANLAATGGMASSMPKATDLSGFRVFGKTPPELYRWATDTLEGRVSPQEFLKRAESYAPSGAERFRMDVLKDVAGYTPEQVMNTTPEQRASAYAEFMGSSAWGAELKKSTPGATPAGQGATDAAAAGQQLIAGPAEAGGRAVDAGAGRGGGPAGARSLEEAQATAARASQGAVVPEGLPTKPLKIVDADGTPSWFVPAPIAQAQKLAADYAQRAGIDYRPPQRYVPVDPDRAGRIADAFEQMPHAPDDPKVQAAYRALAAETNAQMDEIMRAGLKIEFIKPGQKDPYEASPRLAQQDVAENNHLWVFPTDLGYGSGTGVVAGNNPMLQPTKFKIDGRDLVVNDVFRIVHDYFGHFKDGNGFRADGEEHAWRAHSAMYSPEARRAMTTETRGQNSWVNYGPQGAKNRTAKTDDTTFAEQKIGLLPDWVVEEGRLDPGQAKPLAGQPEGSAAPAGVVQNPYTNSGQALFSNRRPVIIPGRERGIAMLDAMGKPTKGMVTLTPEEKLSPAYRAYFDGGNPMVATLEVATTNTKQGARAHELASVIETPRGWQKQALADLEALQRDTMARLADRGSQGQPSPVERLISSAVGSQVQVSGIDTKGYGTFEGVVSPNMRIPLLGRTQNQLWDLSEPMNAPARRAVLAALGQDLDQTASAASQFRTVEANDPAGSTFSIFSPGAIDQAAVGQLEKALGYPLNVHSVAGGTMIDINVGGFDKLPTIDGVTKALEKVLPEGDVYVARRAYDSDYIDSSEYKQAIEDYWKGKRDGEGDGSRTQGVGEAGSPAGSYDDWTAARQAIKDVAKERNRSYSGWVRRYEQKFAAEGLTEIPSVERLATEVPGLKAVMKYMTPDERVKLRRDTAQKIVDLFENLPAAEEMAAVAFAGRAKRGWYRESSKAIVEIFGANDAPRFAALLAAMSPQASVEMNLHNALRTWGNWVAAGRPTEPAEIIRIMGRSVAGSMGEASVLDAWKNNSIRSLAADDPMDIKLSGPKVNSFMQNLRDNVNAVTIDAWMANYSNVSQDLFKGTGNDPDALGQVVGKGPGYVAMSAAVRRAAEVATRKTGQKWTPEEIQETVWSWAKSLYEKSDERGITTNELLKAGGLTHEQINETPDFGRLFVSNVYRKLLEDAGYGKEIEAQLARGGEPDAAGNGNRGDARSAEGSGFTQPSFERHLKRAAERLESLRNDRALNRAKPVDEEAVADALDERFQELAAKYEDNGASRVDAETRAREEVYGDTKMLDGVRVEEVDHNPFSGTDVFSNKRPLIVAPDRLQRSLRKLTSDAAAKGIELDTHSDGVTGIVLSWISRKPREAEAGVGAEVMKKLVQIADKHQAPIDLVAWTDEQGMKDGSGQRLINYYKRFGFDTVGEGLAPDNPDGVEMYRLPKKGGVDLFSNKRPLIVPPGERAPTFYSGLEAAVMGAKLSAAPASQWMGAIKNMPGVKQEELDWVGLPDWLAEQKGHVTKQQVEDYVRANKVQLEETVQGGKMSINRDSKYAIPQFLKIVENASGVDQARIMLANDYDAYQAAMRIPELKDAENRGEVWAHNVARDLIKGGEGAAKFSNYQMDGGKDNYRNILLKLPASGPTKVQLDEKARSLYNRSYDELSDAQLRRNVEHAAATQSSDVFLAPHHWGSEPNVIAHARINDRDVGGAKTLFIEEVQSDWHQQGREKGYNVEEPRYVVRNDVSGNTSERFRTMEEADAFRNTLPSGVRERTVISQLPRKTSGVPDAPLKSTPAWAGVVLKRLIREAAENGYDQIAWTPGDVQNERWDRELQQVRHVSYNPETRKLLAFERDGQEPAVEETVAPEQLPSHIGKEAAKDLLDTKPNQAGFHVLRGRDLRVGGAAFREFYDKILVNVANSIGKKFGAKVGTAEVEGAGRGADGITGTEAMEILAEGRSDWLIPRGERERTQWFSKLDQEARDQLFEDARAKLGRDQKVWTMPITPELRDAAVGKGFALFMKGVPVVRVDHDPFEGEDNGRQRAAAGR